MISQSLKAVILRELDLDDFEIKDTTTADTIPGWDSLSHAQIIAAVEAEFRVRFNTLEVLRLRNIGDLQALIDRKG
jgi:acyl carrier protein